MPVSTECAAALLSFRYPSSNYYRCSCTVLSNMADNKRGRGDRNENQENPNECKSAKAIKHLREVTSLLSEGEILPTQF